MILVHEGLIRPPFGSLDILFINDSDKIVTEFRSEREDFLYHVFEARGIL